MLEFPFLFYTIYKITNNINGKFYIGMHQTTDLDDGYMGSGKLIRAAVKKYGKENFTKQILHVFDNQEDMWSKEKELVRLNEMSYNLVEGGYGGFGYINSNGLSKPKAAAKKAGEIAREKFKRGEISEGTFWFTKEGIKKRTALAHKALRQKHIDGTWIWTGRKHSKSSKDKIGKANSLRQRGANNSQYGTCWISNGIETKKIAKSELDLWIEKGYRRGRR